jgi:hypothetical protein
LEADLRFQLQERFFFIPFDDAQFGSLLHDYADISQLLWGDKAGDYYYNEAVAYGINRKREFEAKETDSQWEKKELEKAKKEKGDEKPVS